MDKVLVVEDEPSVSMLISLVLEDEGYEVQVASDGQEALDSVKRTMPDLILLDSNLPGMEGSEFSRQFRTEYGGQVPIVVISASDDAWKFSDSIPGAVLVRKPFDLDTLLRTVRRWTRKK